MIFHKEPYRGGRGRSNSTIVDYAARYKGKSFSRNRSDDRRRKTEEKIDCQNIVLCDKRSAEDVVDRMRDCIRDEGSVSVAQLYNLLELRSTWTDNNFGWVDDRDVGIRQVRDGFLLDLAEPIALD